MLKGFLLITGKNAKKYGYYINIWGKGALKKLSYSTLLHLPPLRIHCVEGCWDRTQAVADALTTRLDLILEIRQHTVETHDMQTVSCVQFHENPNNSNDQKIRISVITMAT